MSKPSVFRRHPRLAGLVVMLGVFAAGLCMAEIGFRVLRDLVKGGPALERAENVDDDELGWALNPDRKRIVKVNACGETVTRDPPASRYLMKRPGTSGGLPVLFLGDSFTQGTEVSTDGLYYTRFEQLARGRYAVYAAGVGGFGTAQEYVLLRKIIAEVRPRVIVWQLTSNDVEENVFIGRDLSTVQKPRLYLDMAGGKFIIRDPSAWLLRRSELAKFSLGEALKIDRRFDLGLFAALYRGTAVSADVTASRRREGLAVLEHLVGRVVRENPGVTVVGFAADAASLADFRAIFDRQGARFAATMLDDMRRTGKRLDCAPVDAHWNHEGNRLAGEWLLAFVDGLRITGATPARE